MDADLTVSAVRGSVDIKDFLIYRSIDSGAFSLLVIQPVDTINGSTYSATYTDANVVFTTDVRYYAVARDTLFNLSANGNILTLSSAANFVVGTVGAQAYQISTDGVTFQPATTSPSIGQCQQILWLAPLQRWVALGTTGFAYSDSKADIWTVVAISGWGAASTADMAYDPVGNVLVIISDSGQLRRSTDGGLTWSASLLFNVFSTVAWDPVLGLFVIPNDSTSQLRPVYSSPDGLNWTQHPDINSQGCNAAVSNGAGIVGAVGANSGVGFGGGFWSTANGSAWTNNGLTTITGSIRSMDYNGANWGMWGTIGANNIFSRSPSGANGTWTDVIVSTTASGGTTMHIKADPTRNRWWVVGRNRVYRSSDALGTSWTEVLFASATWNAIGVRPAA